MIATPTLQTRRLRLDLLAFPETSPLVLFGLWEVFGAASVVYPEVTSGQPGAPLFDIRVVAPTAEPFRCHGDVLVEPDLSLTCAEGADIVVVCDMYRPVESSPHGLYPEAAAWLRDMHAQGAQICSVCSGALMLAEAGLLDGREAASHWAYAPMFRRHYPQVRLRKGLALCPADEAGRIVTAGAVTAWQDLALHLIARAGLSRRGFARRFRAATGMVPIAYVQTVRVEEAKPLLETGQLAVDEVAHAVGYEDTASFGRIFNRMTGLSPAAYGRKFAALARIPA